MMEQLCEIGYYDWNVQFTGAKKGVNINTIIDRVDYKQKIENIQGCERYKLDLILLGERDYFDVEINVQAVQNNYNKDIEEMIKWIKKNKK